MTIITDNLLNDTLKLIQLAKETAQIRGQTEQASHLTPVADNLQSLVSRSPVQTNAAHPVSVPAQVKPSSEIMAQSDFKTLLSIVENNDQAANQPPQIFSSSSNDRNCIINAMAEGGMSILEISRQMGMTRDEVQMFISLTSPMQNFAIGTEE